MLLAIDIGNTNTVLGVFDGEKLERSWRIKTDARSTADELALTFRGLLADHEITGTAACSTVPAALRELRAMLDVHVVGTLTCAREALRHMQPRRSGHIVVIGSHAAHHAFTDCGGYTAAKAGQLGLTRVLAAEARPYDVRVTALLPGATDTPIWDDRPGFDRSKMMKPEDVASFLLSIVSRPQISVEEVIVTPPAGVL